MNGESSVNANGKINFRLEYEIWMWRGVAIFLLAMNLVSHFVTFTIDRSQHMKDSTERAEHWQMILTNQDRIRGMLNKNHEAILLVDEHLRQCSNCHSHRTDKGGKK